MVKTLLFAFVSLLFVITAMFGITGQKRAVIQQKAQLQKLNGDLANLDTILSDEKSYAPDMKKMTATLPKEYSDVATAVAAIESIAKKNALQPELAIGENATPEPGGLQSISLTLKTIGSYADVTAFTGDLARLPYHTHVDALTFDETGGKISAIVTVRLFMQ